VLILFSVYTSDTDEDMSNTLSILAEFGITSPTEEDISLVRDTTEMMSQRGSYIVATG